MALVRKSYREESRKDYGNHFEEDKGVCLDQLNFGTLARIADAAETIALNYQTILDQRDQYKRWHEEERGEIISLRKTIAGLRGYIKRMKK